MHRSSGQSLHNDAGQNRSLRWKTVLPTRERALLRLELPGVSVPVDRHPHWHSLPGYTDNHDLKPIPINFLNNAARQAPGLLRAALFGVDDMTKEWTDIPPDVHEAIRRVRRFLRLVAWHLSDPEFMADDDACWILAMYADNEGECLDDMLDEYELPSGSLPPLNYQTTDAERIEQRLRAGRRRRRQRIKSRE